MPLRSIESRTGKSSPEFLRPILILLPLLGLYLAIAVAGSSSTFGGDEGGYVENAYRMVHWQGVSALDHHLWWGPGYSLVLVPFILLRLPWTAAKILNAGFLFGAILYFHALMRRYVGGTAALIAAFALGLYPPLMREVPHLLSENLVFFLVCSLMFHWCKLFDHGKNFRLHLAAASAFLAYLALTKVFFGYVIATVLVLSSVLFLWRRMAATRNALLVSLLALVCCVPFLTYTYRLTGRPFYWGTSGGMSLYWISSPYPDEFGSWFSVKDVRERDELAPHRAFFATLDGLSDVEQDDAYKRQALYNITHSPSKFVKNWAANIGRLLFSYPFSFGSDRLSTYFYLAPNMFLIVLFLLTLIPATLRPKTIPAEIWCLLIFDLIAFGGTTLLSSVDRQFRPLVPILLAWSSIVYFRVLKIEFREDNTVVATQLATAALSENGYIPGTPVEKEALPWNKQRAF